MNKYSVEKMKEKEKNVIIVFTGWYYYSSIMV